MPAAKESGGQRIVQSEERSSGEGDVRGCDVHHVPDVERVPFDEGRFEGRRHSAARCEQGLQGT